MGNWDRIKCLKTGGLALSCINIFLYIIYIALIIYYYDQPLRLICNILSSRHRCEDTTPFEQEIAAFVLAILLLLLVAKISLVYGIIEYHRNFLIPGMFGTILAILLYNILLVEFVLHSHYYAAVVIVLSISANVCLYLCTFGLCKILDKNGNGSSILLNVV